LLTAAPFQHSQDWIQAKKRAHKKAGTDYIDPAAGFSDNERDSQTQAEKTASMPAQTYFNELTREQQVHIEYLGFTFDPLGEFGWQTCHDQQKLPSVFDEEYSNLTRNQHHALNLLGITKKLFSQLCSTGVSRKLTRKWADLQKRDQAAAREIGYNTDPKDRGTYWSQVSLEFAENDSGDVVDVSPGYSRIKGHLTLWKGDLPRVIT